MSVNKSNQSPLPSHVGFIVDGNRRWAKQNNLPSLKGHYKGYLNLRDIGIASIKGGIKYVSAFCFSTENWNRSKAEVSYLMKLIVKLLEDDIDRISKEDIKIIHVGAREGLPKRVLQAIDQTVAITKNNKKGTLALCINYGGQQEMIDAARKLLRENTNPRGFTKADFEKALYEPGLPEIDLVIRTSGEYRTSGFMMYRAAYAEYAFVDKLWPDFSVSDLKIVLTQYAKRHRRFGK